MSTHAEVTCGETGWEYQGADGMRVFEDLGAARRYFAEAGIEWHVGHEPDYMQVYYANRRRERQEVG